jgi:hypothetical protein
MATPNQIVEVRSMIADLRSLARAVGGEISGRQVLALGLGHRPQGRSLSIRIEPGAPDGFIVYSFRATNPFACKIMCANVSAYLNGSPATSKTGASSHCGERGSTARRSTVKQRSGRAPPVLLRSSGARGPDPHRPSCLFCHATSVN